eukprot:1068830-Pleurochrysis_carterae.AAC.1
MSINILPSNSETVMRMPPFEWNNLRSEAMRSAAAVARGGGWRGGGGVRTVNHMVGRRSGGGGVAGSTRNRHTGRLLSLAPAVSKSDRNRRRTGELMGGANSNAQ